MAPVELAQCVGYAGEDCKLPNEVPQALGAVALMVYLAVVVGLVLLAVYLLRRRIAARRERRSSGARRRREAGTGVERVRSPPRARHDVWAPERPLPELPPAEGDRPD